MLHPLLQIKNKMLYFQIITCADEKKSLDLNIETLVLEKGTKSLIICQCNILFSQ